MPSALEAQFYSLWERGNPDAKDLEREVQFHPERKWRFDFAHRAARVAIEIEGGLHSSRRANVRGKSMLIVGGRHNSAEGFMGDCEKYAAATFQGWAVIRLAADHITADTVLHLRRFIRARCGIVDQPAFAIFRKPKGGRKWTKADVARLVAKAATRVPR